MRSYWTYWTKGMCDRSANYADEFHLLKMYGTFPYDTQLLPTSANYIPES